MPLYRPPITGTTGVVVRKNSGADVGTQPRLNIIEGPGFTITVANDPGSSEIDVTIAHTPTTAYTVTGVDTDRAINVDSTTLNELLNVVGTMIQDLQARGIMA